MLSAIAVFEGWARTDWTSAAGSDRQAMGKGGNSRSGAERADPWPTLGGSAATELISPAPTFGPTPGKVNQRDDGYSDEGHFTRAEPDQQQGDLQLAVVLVTRVADRHMMGMEPREGAEALRVFSSRSHPAFLARVARPIATRQVSA